MQFEQKTDLETNEQISVKSLLREIHSYTQTIIKNWKLIVAVCILVIAYETIRHFRTIDIYPAELTFMINEEQSRPMTTLDGVLGQFGLGANPMEYNLDKILELLSSRRITQSTLFSKTSINGRQDLLANHFIGHLDSIGKWGKTSWHERLFGGKNNKEVLKKFRFTEKGIDFTDDVENEALKLIYTLLIGDPEYSKSALLSSEYSESSGIMKIKIKTYEPDLSIAMTEKYFETLSDFYIEKSIEKQQTTYDIIKTKYDSIHRELSQVEYSLASFRDRNKGIFSNTSFLEESRLKNRITILTAALAEATKNLEVADFALQNKTPFIQLIDGPIRPLDSDKKSLLRSSLAGLILAVLLSCLFIIARKFIREAMK